MGKYMYEFWFFVNKLVFCLLKIDLNCLIRIIMYRIKNFVIFGNIL